MDNYVPDEEAMERIAVKLKGVSSKAWTMNCLLAGAGVLLIMQSGSSGVARRKLEGLTSELNETDVNYLMMRFEELLQGGMIS